jgi:cytidylate kinase
VSTPHIVVAIDGPAASGKSSVARALARRLKFVYVNTGAMYRAVTWWLLHKGVEPRDTARVISLLNRARVECGLLGSDSTITIDGEDPEPHLSEGEVNRSVSTISGIYEVRHELVKRQRAYAEHYDLVMEGRDIGSAVFPETPYKFYIDASPDVRAHRRKLQGHQDEIGARDRYDSSRKASPLVIAEDAHVIDSSHLTIDGVVGEIVGRLKLKGMNVEEL